MFERGSKAVLKPLARYADGGTMRSSEKLLLAQLPIKCDASCNLRCQKRLPSCCRREWKLKVKLEHADEDLDIAVQSVPVSHSEHSQCSCTSE